MVERQPDLPKLKHRKYLNHKIIYYMEESVLLGTKPLMDSIRHFIQDLCGVFSVCHLCECRIVQWCHDSCLLLLLNWFLRIMKRTLHVGSKIWILCSRGKNNISRVSAALTREILFLPREHKIHIFLPPCYILYICGKETSSILSYDPYWAWFVGKVTKVQSCTCMFISRDYCRSFDILIELVTCLCVTR